MLWMGPSAAPSSIKCDCYDVSCAHVPSQRIQEHTRIYIEEGRGHHSRIRKRSNEASRLLFAKILVWKPFDMIAFTCMKISIDKGRIPLIVLLSIMAIGLYLRFYHIDYPPIGYHSMKEVHYLSVAKGYLDYGDFLHKRVLYSGMSEGPGYIEAFPQFQFLPYIYFG